MTDLDDRLQAAGDAFRSRPVPDLDLHWPAEKRAQRWLVPLAVAAAVALVVAGVLAVRAWRDDPAPPAKPSPVGLPAPSRDYAVGYPYTGGSGGPAVIRNPNVCVNGLRTTATTRRSAEGVVGLITITGRGCSLPVDPKKIGLEDANHHALNVPVSAGITTNPVYSRAYIAENAGRISIGFAWSGSYCGPPAKWVGVLVDGAAVQEFLHIAVQGPSPSCRGGKPDSVLIPGVLGAPHDPVLPPPLTWKSLTAKVVLPSTVGSGPIPLTVVITNAAKAAVSLGSPCAFYGVTTGLDLRGASPTAAISEVVVTSGNLCTRALTVPAAGSITLHLPALQVPAFSGTPRRQASSGDPVTVTWSIAGVESASATTHVR